MTPTQVIATARRILNDEDADLRRTEDAELLEYTNDFLRQLVKSIPSLLIETREISLVAGELQSVDRLTTNGLAGVYKNSAGRHVRLIDIASLEAQYGSTWRNEVAGPTVEWAPMPDDPWGFMVYPPAVAAQKLHVRVTPVPSDLAIGAPMPVADTFLPAAAHYVAGRTLMKNTSVSDTQRGQGLLVIAATLAGIPGATA